MSYGVPSHFSGHSCIMPVSSRFASYSSRSPAAAPRCSGAVQRGIYSPFTDAACSGTRQQLSSSSSAPLISGTQLQLTGRRPVRLSESQSDVSRELWQPSDGFSFNLPETFKPFGGAPKTLGSRRHRTDFSRQESANPFRHQPPPVKQSHLPVDGTESLQHTIPNILIDKKWTPSSSWPPAADASMSRSDRTSRDGPGPSQLAGTRPAEHRTSEYGQRQGLTGLRNIGNTCFLNAVVQCLSNTQVLHDFILKHKYLDDIPRSSSRKKGALIKAFASLMGEIWRPSGSPGRILDPTSFKDQVEKFAPRFTGYDQQDAQELLRYLLEGLHEDVNRVTSRPKPITTDIDDHLSDEQKASESWSRFIMMDNSKFVDVFVGQLKSTLKCTVCGHASVTFDPFWDLSLPIPSRMLEVRLGACLDLFTREEVLDGHEKPLCARCKRRQKCTKKLSIHRFPRILVLHLKRFSPDSSSRGKLTTSVDFPLTALDLTAYSTHSRARRYDLYGVVNHTGTQFSGHYTAHCRHPYSDQWFTYDDITARSVHYANSVVSDKAYVLFYELNNSETVSHL